MFGGQPKLPPVDLPVGKMIASLISASTCPRVFATPNSFAGIPLMRKNLLRAM
jgi:hypothetical protein